jgi:cytochrome b6-f complex iron-sulfur subunit
MLEAAKAEKSAPRVSRRAVITAAGVGWVAFGATAAVGGAVLQRFMMPNVLEEPDPRVRVGPITQFAEMPLGTVNEDFKPRGIWLVRVDGAVAALSTTCTHLGCIPNWLPNDRKFKCPCHGSGFQQTGINFEGPAPRPLERFKVSVEDGILVVDRSKKFQQEKGEWANPDSFVTV